MPNALVGNATNASRDIAEAMRRYELALIFGWQDILQRYRRSRIGAFWITINMSVLIGALGLIFGALFQVPMEDFLPFICAGLIIWGYISGNIGEGCTVFVSSEGMILQSKTPLFSHVMRTLWRNTIILGHNIIILPVILLIFGKLPYSTSPLALLGLLVVILNLSWIMLVCAVICTRYRDLTQIVQNMLQVLFYATPLLWMPSTLPSRLGAQFLELNPLYHFISIIRSPLLGQYPTTSNWVISIAIGIVGWTVTLVFYGKYRSRIAFWL